jgi:ankyrin repeat protein
MMPENHLQSKFSAESRFSDDEASLSAPNKKARTYPSQEPLAQNEGPDWATHNTLGESSLAEPWSLPEWEPCDDDHYGGLEKDAADLQKREYPFQLSCELTLEQKNLLLSHPYLWGIDGNLDPDDFTLLDVPSRWPSYRAMLDFLSDSGSSTEIYNILNLVIKYHPRNEKGESLNELMSTVPVDGDYPETLRLLLERGADIESKCDQYYGRTALMQAAHRGCLQSVTLLLQYRADIHAVDVDGSTALSLAAAGHTDHTEEDEEWRPLPYTKEICELLLKEGADVNTLDNYGNSPLHMAARSGQEDVFDLLRNWKAELGDVNKLLYSATEGGLKSLCEMLIKGGANPQAENAAGSSAMLMAAHVGNVELLRLFGLNNRIPQKTLDRLLCLAVSHQGSDLLCEELINLGANVNADLERFEMCWDSKTLSYQLEVSNKLFINPLVKAIFSRNASACSLLLKNRADPNKQLQEYWRNKPRSPLSFAVKSGQDEVVSQLLKHGAIINPDHQPFPIASEAEAKYSVFTPLKTPADLLAAQKVIIAAILSIKATNSNIPKDILHCILQYLPESLNFALPLHRDSEYLAPTMPLHVTRQLIRQGLFKEEKALEALRAHKRKVLEENPARGFTLTQNTDIDSIIRIQIGASSANSPG